MLEISQILLPVKDVENSIGFYAEILGLPVAMRDGERYATLRAGSAKLALAAPPEREPDRGIAVAFKVTSLAAVVDALGAAGIEPPAVREGEHEWTLEISDPDGHSLIFYAPK